MSRLFLIILFWGYPPWLLDFTLFVLWSSEVPSSGYSSLYELCPFAGKLVKALLAVESVKQIIQETEAASTGGTIIVSSPANHSGFQITCYVLILW